jgi:hypothetical protein
LDAAWGRDHPSALPQIGDILIGVLESNAGGHGEKSKSRIPKVLRSWSRHGKIIMELSRMVEFGTSVSEFDSRSILRQNECAMVDQARAAASLGVNVFSVRSGASSADDFWMLARLILWGNVRPLVVLHSIETGCKCKTEPTSAERIASSELKLSCSAYDFLSGLAFKLEDYELMKDFTDALDIAVPAVAPPLPPAPTFAHFGYGFVSSDALRTQTQEHVAAPVPPEANSSEYMGSVTPPFAPSSPAYMPRSPAYAPSSPAYAPSSPQQSTSISPPSPVYRPSSPVYKPSSPKMTQESSTAIEANVSAEIAEKLVEDTFIVSYKDI